MYVRFASHITCVFTKEKKKKLGDDFLSVQLLIAAFPLLTVCLHLSALH